METEETEETEQEEEDDFLRPLNPLFNKLQFLKGFLRFKELAPPKNWPQFLHYAAWAVLIIALLGLTFLSLVYALKFEMEGSVSDDEAVDQALYGPLLYEGVSVADCTSICQNEPTCSGVAFRPLLTEQNLTNTSTPVCYALGGEQTEASQYRIRLRLRSFESVSRFLSTALLDFVVIRVKRPINVIFMWTLSYKLLRREMSADHDIYRNWLVEQGMDLEDDSPDALLIEFPDDAWDPLDTGSASVKYQEHHEPLTELELARQSLKKSDSTMPLH